MGQWVVSVPGLELLLHLTLDFRGLGGEVSGVFPGQADGVDFCGFWLIEAVA